MVSVTWVTGQDTSRIFGECRHDAWKMLYKQKRIPVILPHKNRIRFRFAEQWQPPEEIISVSVA